MTQNYIVPLPETASLTIKDSPDIFPVRRIYCVGQNYADHAIEMGHDPKREPPFFFQKNPDNIVHPETVFPYPAQSENVHHEVELVVMIGKSGFNISVSDAMDFVLGYAVGLDMTCRDLQADAKAKGRPWALAKAFEHSAPMGRITLAHNIPNIAHGDIWLKVNGALRQSGNIAQLIWNIPEIIAHLSRFFSLHAGDVIMTGTPAGVGPVARGDRLHAHIDGLDDLMCKVV